MKLLFLGDFIYDYNEINEDIKKIGEFIKKNNCYTILNLEAPLKGSKSIKKEYVLNNTQKVINVLKDLNVIAVNLANNHIMDWNTEGIKKTLREFEKNNIIFFGAGLNYKMADENKFIYINGKKIALVGCGWKEEMCVPAKINRPGVLPLKTNKIINKIEKLRGNVDRIVVIPHWGYEYELYPLPIHRELAHKLIDHGADLIIGHHSHVIQSFEKYNNRLIFYGLGNFYFGSRRKNYEKSNNEISRNYSKYGLGVITDENLNFIKNITIKYKENVSYICQKNKVHDISNIDMKNYNKYFIENRTSKRKPALLISRNDNMINWLKLFLCRYKEKFKKLIIKFLMVINMYEKVKKILKRGGQQK